MIKLPKELIELANKWEDESDGWIYGGNLGSSVALSRCANELKNLILKLERQ